MTTDEYVQHVLAQAPPLTQEQRSRLVELLRPVRIRADRQQVAA